MYRTKINLAVLSLVLWASGVVSAGEWEWIPASTTASDAQFRAVALGAQDDVWAGGWMNAGPGPFLLLVMHYDGVSWTDVGAPTPGFGSGIEAMGIAPDGSVWAAGYQRLRSGPFGTIKLNPLIMKYDGSTWQVLNTPNIGSGGGAKVRGLTVIDNNDIWFCGDWGSSGLALHWDGSNLTRHLVPDINTGGSGTYGTGVGLTSVSALGPNAVFAVGGASDGDFTGASTIFRWNGTDWIHLPGPTFAPSAHRLFSVTAISPTNVVAVGGADQTGPIALRFDGSAWSEDPLTGFVHPGGELDAITAISANDIWAAGTYTVNPPPDTARPLLLHFDGSQWTQFPSDPAGPFSGWFRGLDSLSATQVHVVGSGGFAPHSQRYEACGSAAVLTGGAGKSGLMGVPTLAADNLPVLPSTNFRIVIGNALPALLGYLVVGFSRVDAPFDQGVLYPAPDLLVPVLADPTGQIVLPLPLGSHPALCGLPTLFQALFPGDPGAAGPRQTAQSNWLEVVFGT